MKKIIIIISIISFLACSQKSSAVELTIIAADEAYDKFDLKKSSEILNTILENSSLDNETRCKALRRLAHQDWKYFKNSDLALKGLALSDSLGADRFKTWMLISRVERENENFQKAIIASKNAEKFASSDKERTDAILDYNQNIYEYSINNLINGLQIDTVLLDKASQLTAEILNSNIGSPKPSKLLLGISLLRNDGANVMKAWKSYFHIQDINSAYPYLEEAAKNLKEVCVTGIK